VSEGPEGTTQGWADRGAAATAALAETWNSMREACLGAGPEEWDRTTECPGWSVKDQISHLIGIERLIMGEAAPEWEGPLGDHVKNDFAALNERWVATRRPVDGAAVLDEFADVTARRLDTLRSLGDEEWATVGFSPVGQAPHARFMETRVFDSWVHEQDVRLALARPGGTGGLASGFSLDQVQAAMAFVVGKKVAPPEGTVVGFAITGPPGDARRFAIVVDGGRARPADSGDGDRAPTVSLAMPSLTFVRLGCGRTTVSGLDPADQPVVEGDPVLGRRILAAMNFMF
jgi:uncharacterized protein (TIGR03083 family)